MKVTVIDQNNSPLKGEPMEKKKKAASLLLAHLVSIRVHGEALAQALVQAPWGTERENWTVVQRVKAAALVRIFGLQVTESNWSLFK